MSKRDQPLKRRHGSRPERQRFLIYCEGSVTEEHYLKGLKRELRAGTVAIKIGADHGEPYRLVKAAIEHQRRAPQQAEDRYEAYDQVWCVIDVEAPLPQRLKVLRSRAFEAGNIRTPTLKPSETCPALGGMQLSSTVWGDAEFVVAGVGAGASDAHLAR